ncbi:hypothetical protein PsYK624_111660 [Phanerochaete sordida]|uniref:Uncharacterized protein n=1 Tax=Phanerochaete sordida TaxID=48140 RepID=A0A9P3LHU2_9APHY|nr:hypothetical protein PsYK624_111660 [Phanerochaete sordida]
MAQAADLKGLHIQRVSGFWSPPSRLLPAFDESANDLSTEPLIFNYLRSATCSERGGTKLLESSSMKRSAVCSIWLAVMVRCIVVAQRYERDQKFAEPKGG